MNEKKTVLIRTYHVMEVEEEELTKENGLLDELITEVSQDKELDLSQEVSLKWQGTAVVPLLPELNNCGRCAACGAWTTDREKENPIEGLTNGAVVEGKLLCDECLPGDHPWAF